MDLRVVGPIPLPPAILGGQTSANPFVDHRSIVVQATFVVVRLVLVVRVVVEAVIRRHITVPGVATPAPTFVGSAPHSEAVVVLGA
jgi:hypothetical protein